MKKFPLSNIQQRLLSSIISDTGSIAYIMARYQEFNLSDQVLLERALGESTCKSFTLRLTQNDDGEYMQYYGDSIEISHLYTDLRGKELQTYLDSLAYEPFKTFLDEPLIRFILVRNPDVLTFVISAHHIICDGGSFYTIGQDIKNSIEEQQKGNEIPIRNSHTFEEAVEAEQLYLSTKQAAEDREFWINHLADIEDYPYIEEKEDVKLPLDFIDVKFTQEESSSFLNFCRSFEKTVSPFSFVSALFSLYLARFHRTSDVVVTNAINTRTSDFKECGGMFVNTVPLRYRYNGDLSVRELIKESKDTLKSALTHSRMPFNLCVGELQEKGVDVASLFSYSIVSNSNDINATIVTVETHLLPLVIRVNLGKLDTQGLQSLRYVYNPALFTREEILLMAESIRELLLDAVTNPDKMCGDLNMVSKNHFEQMMKFNQTAVEYDASKSVTTLFREQVVSTPNNIALAYLDKRYTYKELDEITDALAKTIAENYIEPGEAIAVLIHRSEYMVIASLGAHKARCAYQPLDPSYPSDRLTFMVNDTNAKFLIADEDLLSLLPEYKGAVILTKEIPNLFKKSNLNNIILKDPAPEDLFIYLYTSGSTGMPKGCMLEHRNMVAFCNWYQRFYNLQPNDATAVYASYGFDAHMMDLYPAITCGATVHIIDEDIRLDLVALSEYIRDNHIKSTIMTTQVGRQFAIEADEPTSLLYLSTGGEKLVPLDPPKNFQLINAYGPTECTILVTAYPVMHNQTPLPIGCAIDNTRLYIVDQRGHRQPIGGIGELWISGVQVARGYLNRAEEQAKAFIANPFAAEEPEGFERVYRTGDVVRYMADGNIEFIGRKDSQVKIRGYRIELSEVEAVVRQYPGIKDATVVAYDMEDGSGKYIVAYVVSNEQVDVEALGDFIMETKPPYMVPAVTMQLEEIPLNQNQKVNRRALPKPEVQIQPELNDTGGSIKPLNILEQQLAEIIQKMLSVENFGVGTRLTNIGLTSISALKLTATLYKRFGVKLDSRELIKNGTLLSIEDTILTHLLNGEMSAPIASPKDMVHVERCGLSYSQTGVFYECMKHPAETIYNVPMSLNYSNTGVSASSLISAVRSVIEAHSVLMTRFELNGDAVVQYILRSEVVIPELNLSKSELEKYRHDFVRPFNLFKDQLFRAEVITCEEELYLMVDFHHLIFDGASLDLFINELNRVLEGGTPCIESFTAFDLVESEKEVEQSEVFQAREKFYDNLLSECEGANLINSDLGGIAEEGHFAEVLCEVNREEVARFCSEQQLTDASLFLAATTYTIARYSGSRNAYISTISSGRSDVRIAESIGMYVKTLPLAATIADQTALEYVQAVESMFNSVLSNEEYPFYKIASKYNFQPEIMYAYQVGVVGSYEVNGKRVSIEKFGLERSKFKLAVHIEEQEGKLYFALQYNNALYSQELIEHLALSMRNTLQSIISSPKMPVRSISLLDSKQQQVIESFCKVATDSVDINLYHKAIEYQAEVKESHTALIAADASYTYREFNEEANRIAHSLISMGVKCGDRVALLLPRTSNVLLSMFAVMKCGAAYIPCDPEYPTDRIQHILDDSKAAYVITTPDRLNEFPNCGVDVSLLRMNESTQNPSVEVDPTSLAYLIYTSGSTGKPKGVMLQHKGICNYLTSHPANRHIYAMTQEGSCTLSVTTVSFDMSLKEIGTTLFNGLTLVFASQEQANNPMQLAELFKQTGADIFNATPSRMLMYMDLPAICEALSHCKVIMAGGEKFPDVLLKRLREVTKARIFNTYGPTEITVSSNAKELTESDAISIGQPLLNYKEYIVDIDGNKLPIGVIGELYIGGAGVALGYNNLPEQTKDRFIDYQGERVYKSGDYARWNKQGDVEVLGRTDNQVKLRGLRIELSEIESAMTSLDSVRTAVAMIRTIGGKEYIVTYYTLNSNITSDEIKEAISNTLPSYMVPSAYVELERLPLTPNGKIDLKALPEPIALSSINSTGEKPRNEVEALFCQIFSHILEVENIGATDNFFQMGGTSLTVTRVIIEAAKAGYTIAYGDLFIKQTPRELASLVATELSELTSDKLDNFFTDYDYSAIQSLLDRNTIENFKKGKKQKIGNVLLTGATGFLGIHTLRDLIELEDSKIYCLIRASKGELSESRLKSLLYYYFEDSYSNLFGTRIIVVDGDISNSNSIIRLQGEPIDTVINCAANVKHFSQGTDIEDVNVGGVANLIKFCEATNARLVHVSTMSVGGASLNGYPPPTTTLKENMLFFGQYINNKYVNSKFAAERMILEAVVNNKLNAKIMRVGNLSARFSDGEFQVNYMTNTFMGRIKSYCLLGKCPYSRLDTQMEFSPIEHTSKAIVLLSKTPKSCTVFHPFNHHFVLLDDIFMQMNGLGFDVKMVEDEEFDETLRKAKEDPYMAKVLSSMMAYENIAHGQVTQMIGKNNSYTMQVLYHMGFHWPTTSWDYICRFLQALEGLGFFEAQAND